MEQKYNNFVCIASGPSLTEFQIEVCKKAYSNNLITVIVINDNYKLAPWADHLYAADKDWWELHIDTVKETNFKGKLWIPNNKDIAIKYGLNIIPCKVSLGLGKNGILHCGKNSGYQAINLAYYLNAKTIFLIGFDMKISKNGKRHWFGDHPEPLRNNSPYTKWIEHFEILSKHLAKENVKVINCSLDTAIPYFKRGTLEKEFENLQQEI
jgi:hypothetical protein